MNEEELFCKLFPDYVVNGKPLSPYFDLFESGYEQVEKRVEELEKENADLKCECRRCVYSDTFCIVSDYGKDKNGICDHFKDVFNENTELRNRNQEFLESCEGATMMYKDLCKAKELLKRFIELENCTLDYDDVKEAEQFIKDSEVE